MGPWGAGGMVRGAHGQLRTTYLKEPFLERAQIMHFRKCYFIRLHREN